LRACGRIDFGAGFCYTEIRDEQTEKTGAFGFSAGTGQTLMVQKSVRSYRFLSAGMHGRGFCRKLSGHLMGKVRGCFVLPSNYV
jgi:hypothetical protein